MLPGFDGRKQSENNNASYLLHSYYGLGLGSLHVLAFNFNLTAFTDVNDVIIPVLSKGSTEALRLNDSPKEGHTTRSGSEDRPSPPPPPPIPCQALGCRAHAPTTAQHSPWEE